ncbi:MAG: hypothetical protein RR232_07245 [Clostridia bacterium]
MRNRIILALVTLIVMTSICACAVPAASPVTQDERALLDARSNYRNASLVISGECVQVHIGSNGKPCCDIRIDELVAGNASVGDTLHCTNSAMLEGDKYLLYLSKNGDVSYSEDSLSYSLVSALVLKDNTVNLSGAKIPYHAIKSDIAKLNLVISGYSSYSYFGDISALIDAADEVFIGRVDNIGEFSDTQFRVSEAGSTVEYTIPSTVANITAFGGIKGALKYGEKIKLIYAPAMSADVIDAATLTSVPYGEQDAPKLQEDGVYVFFLIHGPDDKQDYYFSINPMQGFVKTETNTISVAHVNNALLPYRSLNDLVAAIRFALNS